MSKMIITFGTWNNKPIEWLVLKDDGFKMLCVSKDILFERGFNDSSTKGSDYSKSDIRKYLNKEFYNSAFSETVKRKIVNHKISGEFSDSVKDDVFLLSMTEIRQLMTQHDRTVGRYWWTRNAYNSDKVYEHSSNSSDFYSEWPNYSRGIRPAIYVKK